jgi:hypothetical protein
MLRMATRIYFHLVRAHERIVDRTGLELPDDVVTSDRILEFITERWPGIAAASEWEGWSVQIVADDRIVRTISLGPDGFSTQKK